MRDQAEATVCTIDSCDKPMKVKSRGLCSGHYQRWQKYGDPTATCRCRAPGCEAVRPDGDPDFRGKWSCPDHRSCTVDGCDGDYRASGYCSAHWERWNKYGDPVGTALCREDGCDRGRVDPGQGPPYCAEHSTCSEDGCDRKRYKHGLCSRHHQRVLAEADPDYYRDAVRRSYWRNADKSRRRGVESAARRRVRLRDGGSAAVSDGEWQRLRTSPCLACGGTDRVEADHLIPVARGGRHAVGNLIPLCRSCNSSKKDLTWAEWKHSGRPRAVAVFGTPAPQT